MRYPFLDLRQSDAALADELKEAACRVIESGRYIHGEECDAFERELAAAVGTSEAVGVSNGLDAIRLIFRAYMELGNLMPGDGVIIPANTYIASVLPVSELGLRPILVEPDSDTMNLDFNLASRHFDDARAIMCVHLYGTPAWDAETISEAADRGMLVIEDNAQAIGARAAEEGLNGDNRTGSLGHASAMSFYPTKNVGAIGDAGAVTTSDPELAATVRALANYGSDRRYHNIFKGYNCRLDEIQAAMLRVKLRHLDEITRRRNRIARIYDSAISNPEIHKPRIFEDMTQVWHQYVIRSRERDAFREYLASNGVGTDIHYAVPPHMQPCYRDLCHGALPLTELLASEVVSLPIAHVSEEDAAEIASIINNF